MGRNAAGTILIGVDKDLCRGSRVVGVGVSHNRPTSRGAADSVLQGVLCFKFLCCIKFPVHFSIEKSHLTHRGAAAAVEVAVHKIND